MSKRFSGESLKLGKSARSFFSLLLLSVLVFSFGSVVVSQPDQKRAREIAKVRDKITKCASKANSFSELKLKHRGKLRGQVRNPDDKKFTLTELPSRRDIEISYEEVSKVRCEDFTARMYGRAFLFALITGVAMAGIAAVAH
jgi:hypothetical protein